MSLRATLKPDEQVLFFPTFAAPSATSESWNVRIHAWVFESQVHSLGRTALVKLFSRKLGLSDEEVKSELYTRRTRPFLYENERGRFLPLRIGEHEFTIGPSEKNGHLKAELNVPTASIAALTPSERSPWGAQYEFIANVPSAPFEKQSFSVSFIPRDGISVISDFDDTLKISDVADKKALLRNTFIKEFMPVSGMPALLSKWSEEGAFVHYISAAPWQLSSEILQFLEQNDFPNGSLSLKSFRWADSSFFDLFAKSNVIKRPLIEQVISAFPNRRFILLGDSGEADPELYLDLAIRFPEQVSMILIRSINDTALEIEKCKERLRDLPKTRWMVFSDPKEILPHSLNELVGL